MASAKISSEATGLLEYSTSSKTTTSREWDGLDEVIDEEMKTLKTTFETVIPSLKAMPEIERIWIRLSVFANREDLSDGEIQFPLAPSAVRKLKDIGLPLEIIGSSDYFVALHDATLKKIDINAIDKNIALYFHFESKDDCSLRCQQVKAFRCEDLNLQNVVSKIRFSSKDYFTDDELEYRIKWATSTSDTKSWLSEDVKEKWIEKIKTGDLALIYVEPSAGAQIVIICAQFSVKDRYGKVLIYR